MLNKYYISDDTLNFYLYYLIKLFVVAVTRKTAKMESIGGRGQACEETSHKMRLGKHFLIREASSKTCRINHIVGASQFSSTPAKFMYRSVLSYGDAVCHLHINTTFI